MFANLLAPLRAKLNLAVAQCDNKFCRSAVFRAMRAVHVDMRAFRKRCGSSVLESVQ